jgi:hypothetical protein
LVAHLLEDIMQVMEAVAEPADNVLDEAVYLAVVVLVLAVVAEEAA